MVLILPPANFLEIQTADLFQEPPGVVVVLHPLSHQRFPALGYKELAQLPPFRKHQIQARVQFPASALAGGLAAGPSALRQVPAQHTTLGNQPGQSGAGLPFSNVHVGPRARLRD